MGTMSLEVLDSESYLEKVHRFGLSHPYVDSDQKHVSIRNATYFPSTKVATDGKGNITDMPLLVGKPCFGIITAYLRHGLAHPTIRDERFRSPGTRCGRCRVKHACVSVCKERIGAVPALSKAVAHWYEHGGRDQFHTHDMPETWSALIETAARKIYKSSNDKAVSHYWVSHHARRKSADAARKQKEREAAIAHYEARQAQLRKEEHLRRRIEFLHDEKLVSWSVVEQVFRVRIERAAILLHAKQSDCAPSWLRRLSKKSVWLMASVWAARQLRILSGRKCDPWDVANIMYYENWRMGFVSFELLPLLDGLFWRIDKLERNPLVIGDLNIWAPFDARDAGVPTAGS